MNLTNGRVLSISVVNSPLGSLPEKDRSARAAEAARVAYRSLRSRASLERVVVSFVDSWSYAVVNVSKTSGSYAFAPAELQEGGGAARP